MPSVDVTIPVLPPPTARNRPYLLQRTTTAAESKLVDEFGTAVQLYPSIEYESVVAPSPPATHMLPFHAIVATTLLIL
jgi:hypothetical protein